MSRDVDSSTFSNIQGLHDPVPPAQPEATLPEEHALALLHKHNAAIRSLCLALAAQLFHQAPSNTLPLPPGVHYKVGDLGGECSI